MRVWGCFPSWSSVKIETFQNSDDERSREKHLFSSRIVILQTCTVLCSGWLFWGGYIPVNFMFHSFFIAPINSIQPPNYTFHQQFLEEVHGWGDVAWFCLQIPFYPWGRGGRKQLESDQIIWGSPTAPLPLLKIIDSTLLATNFWLFVGKTQMRAFLSGNGSLVLSEEGRQPQMNAFQTDVFPTWEKKSRIWLRIWFG